MIVNITRAMAQQGIASIDDVGAAVQIGLCCPQGPLAWGDVIGHPTILTILRNMHEITGDRRYRPSLYLKGSAEHGPRLAG